MGTVYTGQKSPAISESRETGGYGKGQGDQRGDPFATLEEATVMEFMEVFRESRNRGCV
ncbi:MAG: hypothetical protein IJ794_04440 [Lachnospiraceae bacterium]|nr:hypothetical protein [Lachnospiraceae bacterium]